MNLTDPRSWAAQIFFDPAHGRTSHRRIKSWRKTPATVWSQIHRRSILSSNVRVNSFAQVESSILFEGVDVGRHCRIRRAIIDKDVKIPPGTTIGYDLEHDRRRGFTITEQGVVVIAKAELPETFASPR